jgi:multiple sugar transport system permease protein
MKLFSFNRVRAIPKYLLLSALAVFALFPLLFAAYSSLQKPEDYGTWVGLGSLTMENFSRVNTIAPIGRWYFNTIVVVAVVVLGNLIMDTLAGYALARFSFPGKNLIFLLILGVMIVPLQAYLIPLYIWVARWGWLNSYLALTMPLMVYPFGIFLMRQFFLTIPRELEEAARVDGLGRFGTFARIILPISKPPLATLFILAFTWTWNNFIVPVTMNNNPDYFVISVGLNSLKDAHFDWPTVNMAGVMYLTIPVIFAFILMQKHIIQGIATSGLKG